jgi:signal transduction histidine kinase
MSRAARALAIACLAAAAWLGCAGSAVAALGCTEVAPVAQAQRTLERAGEAPVTELAQLPDRAAPRWRPGSALRYRLDLGTCEGTATRVLLIARAGGPYRITAEGGELHNVRGSRVDLTLNGRVGGLFLLDPGVRAVTLDLQGAPNVSGAAMGTRVGPPEAMFAGPAFPYRAWQWFSGGAAVVIGIAALLTFGAWAMRRQERYFFWFGLSCAVWSLRGHVLGVQALPLPPAVFEPLNPLLIGFAALAQAAYTFSALGSLGARRARLLAVGAVLLSIGAAVAMLVPAVAGIYRLAGMALGFGVLATTIWLFTRERRAIDRARANWLALGFSCVIVGGSHDLLMILGLLRPTWWTLLTPGFALMMLCHLVAAGLYLLRMLRRAERANVELEAAIAARTSELQASYELLRDNEREHAREQARSHLLREMHDGIGAQLITTLRGVERAALTPQQIQDALQDGLDELRLLMDSSDAGRTLHGALIAWRNRWDSRLDALDVTLRWQLDERVEAITMDPGDVLQLMRVLQEAVTNVVKHAGARHADVRIALDPQGPWLELDVADDGCGFPADAAMRGRGTSNMRTRARLLGGSLAIEARGGGAGTVVRLRVPVQVAGVQRAAVAMAK